MMHGRMWHVLSSDSSRGLELLLAAGEEEPEDMIEVCLFTVQYYNAMGCHCSGGNFDLPTTESCVCTNDPHTYGRIVATT